MLRTQLINSKLQKSNNNNNANNNNSSTNNNNNNNFNYNSNKINIEYEGELQRNIEIVKNSNSWEKRMAGIKELSEIISEEHNRLKNSKYCI